MDYEILRNALANLHWFESVFITASVLVSVAFMHRQNKIDRIRMHKENIDMYRSFSCEMKDFHGRLCTLEERYMQMMQRILEKK